MERGVILAERARWEQKSLIGKEKRGLLAMATVD